MPWLTLPLDQAWYPGLDELALTRSAATLENAYINEAQGQSRFPDLVPYAQLPGGGRVYLKAWSGGLLAVTGSGRAFGIDRDGYREHVGTPVAAGRRPTFDETFDGLLIGGGGQIVSFDGGGTRVLSPEAPEVSHVGFVKDYVLGLVADSGDIAYSVPGLYQQWPLLNAFRADSRPDKSVALLVNQFNELFVFGRQSCEMFMVSGDADQPFYLRGQVGDGLWHPDCLVEGPRQVYGVNKQRQVVAYTLAGGQPVCPAIDRLLERQDDWTDAWMAEFPWAGRRFLLLQVPRMAGTDGAPGVTFLVDLAGGKPSLLHGWDEERHGLSRWPVRSVAHAADGSVYAGGDDGQVYRLSDARDPAAVQSRYRYRSAAYAASSIVKGSDSVEVTNLRVRLVRRFRSEDPGGGVPGAVPPMLRLRARVGQEPWNEWLDEPIDLDPEEARPTLDVEYGAVGAGESVQVEIESFCGAPLDVAQLQVDARGHGA